MSSSLGVGDGEHAGGFAEAKGSSGGGGEPARALEVGEIEIELEQKDNPDEKEQPPRYDDDEEKTKPEVIRAHEARAEGLRADVVSYTCLAQSYIQQGDAARCETLVKRMLDDNVPPDTIFLNTVLSGYARQLLYYRAFDFLQRMQVC